MKEKIAPQTIIVAGDVTMDWHLARKGQAKKGSSFWSPDDPADISWQRGGASLLADLLEAIGADLLKEKAIPISIRQPGVPRTSAEVIPGDPKYHHSFAIWAAKKYAEKPPLDKEKAWRVDEFLGLRLAESLCPAMQVVDDSLAADIVVLDDANLGFRNARECWPLSVKEPGAKPAWFFN